MTLLKVKANKNFKVCTETGLNPMEPGDLLVEIGNHRTETVGSVLQTGQTLLSTASNMTDEFRDYHTHYGVSKVPVWIVKEACEPVLDD